MVLVRYRSPILYLALGGVYHLGSPIFRSPLFGEETDPSGTLLFRLHFQAARLLHRSFLLGRFRVPTGLTYSSAFEVAYGNLTLSVPTFLTDFAPLP